MTEITTVADLTLDEAKHNLGLAKSVIDLVDSVAIPALIALRNRRGWMVLGYESWESCLKEEFKLSENYLNRLISADRNRKLLGPIGPEIPERQLRALNKIPESERAAIFAEANRMAEESGKARTAKMVAEAVAGYETRLNMALKRAEYETGEKEQFRLQDLDRRNRVRELEMEISALKVARKETIFIPSDPDAYKQIKEERGLKEQKIAKLKLELKKANQTITELGNSQDDMERRQRQEIALQNSISKLQAKDRDLEAKIGRKVEQDEAMEKYRRSWAGCEAYSSLLFEHGWDDSDKAAWLEIFGNSYAWLDKCRTMLEDIPANTMAGQPGKIVAFK